MLIIMMPSAMLRRSSSSPSSPPNARLLPVLAGAGRGVLAPLLPLFFPLPLPLLAAAAAAAPQLADIPWVELEGALFSDGGGGGDGDGDGGDEAASLIDATPSDYVDECYPVFRKDAADRTNHDLIDQPSGVCMDHLFCGFERCDPTFAGGAQEPDLSVRGKWAVLDAAVLADEEQGEEGGSGGEAGASTAMSELLDPSNPSYNLPTKVLFPRSARDIYAAVDFAKRHGIQLSVKNSGHSYTGASTKKDTLLLNMNRFRRYSNSPDGGLIDCDAKNGGSEEGTTIDADLGNQPCRLAAARNKPAALRVGGGENFDKAYRAVKERNEARGEDGYRYHLVGGAAGTVSPMGWTWQGGLSGTTNGRTHGFGVDQVLQVEMVLPTLHHVRFGPTKWETAEGYQYPRTTEVAGVCNENPNAEDESEWVWSECPEDADIDFGELWYAVNGGGGGTYGVVASVHLQLHDYVAPASWLVFGNGALTIPPCNLTLEDAGGPLGEATWSFLIDFLLDPEALGVPANVSNACAAPAYLPNTANVFCYGNGTIEAMLSSWASFLSERNETLVQGGVPPASIETASTCFADQVASFVDYSEVILIPDGPHSGKARDLPVPAYLSTTEKAANVLIPKAFAVDSKDQLIQWLMAGALNYWAFGGNTATAQDQANSLSDAHRGAGLMLFFPLEFLDEDFYQDVFPKMYNVSDGDRFAGFIGSNHAGPNTRGPLKDDWSKPCSVDWTQEERDEKCIPLQEAIWGTEKLARLEAVKDAVDPNRMLDCYGCVGNNRPANVAATSPPEESGATSKAASPSTTNAIVGSFSLINLCFCFFFF